MLAYRGHRLQITASHTTLTVTASPCDAAPVTVRAAGRLLQITGGQTLTVPPPTSDMSLPTNNVIPGTGNQPDPGQRPHGRPLAGRSAP